MATAMTLPGLAPTDWAFLVALIERCSPDQLKEIRQMIDGAKEVTTLEIEIVGPETKSMQWALQIWDELKADSDPAAKDLPPETIQRIAQCVRLVRNRTLTELSAMIDKSYSRFTATVIESIGTLKE